MCVVEQNIAAQSLGDQSPVQRAGMQIRLDQAPLHSGSGVRQLGGVSVVPDKCSGAKERSVGAENGSRLQAGPALTKISNCQFKFNSFQVQIDRFKYIMPMTLVHNNIY